MKYSLVILLLLACASPEAESTAAAEAQASPTEKATQLDIVDRAIAHHGGELFADSRVQLTVTSKSGSFDIDTRLGRELFDHRIVDRKDGTETVHHQTNDSLTVTRDGAAVELDARRAESYVNQRMYFLLLPYKLNDPGTYKEDLGLEEWESRSLRKVRVSFQEGSSDGADDTFMYWFDPETARLVQFAYDYDEGTGLRFRRLFDYREIGGLLFYNAENYGRNTRSGGLSVNSITPEYLESTLPLVSTIRLSNIEVARLSP